MVSFKDHKDGDGYWFVLFEGQVKGEHDCFVESKHVPGMCCW